MKAIGKIALPALVLCVLICGALAQPAKPPACVVDPPTFVTNAPNIFNDRQEQDLGDALAESDLSKGWNDQRVAWVSGEFVLVQGEHGNTVIYRLDSGAKVGEFFGEPVTTDADTNLIAAVNREDEILLVDERSGKELKRFTLGSPVRLARIVTGKEKLLLVLTADQVVHRLALPE
jgi:hypothetical protein